MDNDSGLWISDQIGAADSLQAAISISSTQRIRGCKIVGCSSFYAPFMALQFPVSVACSKKAVGFFLRIDTIAAKES